LGSVLRADAAPPRAVARAEGLVSEPLPAAGVLPLGGEVVAAAVAVLGEASRAVLLGGAPRDAGRPRGGGLLRRGMCGSRSSVNVACMSYALARVW